MADDSEKEMAEKITLYHYTDKKGQEGIHDSGKIKESQESGTKDDAVFGDGVYLTSIPPSDGKIEIAANNYDGSAQDVIHMINSGYVDNYVKVELDAKDVVQVDDERDIYLHSGDLDLDKASDVSYGEVTNIISSAD